MAYAFGYDTSKPGQIATLIGYNYILPVLTTLGIFYYQTASIGFIALIPLLAPLKVVKE